MCFIFCHRCVGRVYIQPMLISCSPLCAASFTVQSGISGQPPGDAAGDQDAAHLQAAQRQADGGGGRLPLQLHLFPLPTPQRLPQGQHLASPAHHPPAPIVCTTAKGLRLWGKPLFASLQKPKKNVDSMQQLLKPSSNPLGVRAAVGATQRNDTGSQQ